MPKIVILLLTLLLVASACSRFQHYQKSTDVNEKYRAALKYFGKRDYYRSGLLLEDIIPLLKGDTTAETAQFKYAYTQYYQGQLTMSAYLFNKFYETFARSPYAQEARYMHAYSLYADSPTYNLDQTNTYKAVDALQSFINAYPDSEYNEKAGKLLAELRVKLEKKAYEQAKLFNRIQGNYKAAIITLGNFQKSYPDSDFNEEIAFKKLEAEYNLAKESVESKKRERYEKTVEFYETFVDIYPQSRYIRQAENMYESSVKFLGGKSDKTGAKTKEENKKEDLKETVKKDD
jgi:outer membrane protein assembly factor BamD